jgi:hypothetical protein
VLLQKTILDTSTLMPSLASSSAACKDNAKFSLAEWGWVQESESTKHLKMI